MPLTLERLSDNPCSRDCTGSVERRSDTILTIHDTASSGFWGLITNIDLSAGTITRTRKFFVFTWRKAYSIDDYPEIEIQDMSQLMEGYQLPLFVVYLAGNDRRLRIYSTDNLMEATITQKTISDFLQRANMSTLKQQ